MIASEQTLLDHVAAHAGEGAEIASVIEDVLASIDPATDLLVRELIAGELPPRFAQVVRRRGGKRLLLRGPRLEVAASVCHALAEELSDDAVAALSRALPDPLAGWLVADAPEGREPAMVEPHRTTTLAEGRPGSRAPLDEARPRGGQAGSVADEDPHANTKLSSSAGTTQERDHDTLADGHPGSDRPLAGR
jgi:hypothetical protein